MPLIHSSAIVDSKAQIADDVEIGAYTIVGPDVVIGQGTKVGAHTIIEGHTTIGCNNSIGHYASVGAPPQHVKYKNESTQLVIGDRNVIREFTSLHRGTPEAQGITQIGDDNWIMAYVHIAHDCVVGNHTLFTNNAQIAGHVKVGNWAILGGMSGVHQFVQIGEHAMLGGLSRLVQDLPPYVIAAGNDVLPHGLNVKGLSRRGFSDEAILALRKAYKLLYKSDLTLEEAKKAIWELANTQDGTIDSATVEKLKVFHDFIAGSKRGIVR
jgi:UDP-N-acetylglucosamine acyltransferase